MGINHRRMPKLHIGIEVLAVIAQLLIEKAKKWALIPLIAVIKFFKIEVVK